MAQKKRITISGYYGFANAGDEAVLSAIVSSFQKKAGDKVDITVLSASPEETEAVHKVRAVSRMSISDVTKAIRECDLFISGGGSLLQDATSMQSLIYYLITIMLAKIYRRKVMLLGQGIGPLRRGISRRLTSLVLNRVDLITVRDPQSGELLREIGVTKPKILVTADPTLILDPCSNDEAYRLLAELGIGEGEDVIAVSLRNWDGVPGLEAAERAAFEHMVKKLSVRFLFVTMQIPSDKEISEKVSAALENTAVQQKPWTIEQLIGVLGKCRMVVGMRLHALILASTAGVPSIGISYDPKVEYFLKITGQEGITLTDVADGLLEDRVIQAWNKRTELADKLVDSIPPMKNSADENIIQALELLNL